MTGRATPYRVIKIQRLRPVWVDFAQHQFDEWYVWVWWAGR